MARVGNEDLLFVPEPPAATKGELLAHRYEARALGGMKGILAAFLTTLITAPVAAVMLAATVLSRSGSIQLVTGAFALIWIAITGYAGWTFLRRAAVAWRVGPSYVELSREIIEAGEPFEVGFIQTGPIELARINVRLECMETSVTRRLEGDQTLERVTEKIPLFDETSVKVGKGEPLVLRREVTISPRSMHSFTAEHHRVRWRVMIEGIIPQFVDLERQTVVIVVPPTPPPDIADLEERA